MRGDYGIGARMRAARHLRGFRNMDALAAAIGGQKLGATKLREIEREERPPQFSELQEIAYHCNIHVAFFTADFSRLPEISDEPRRVIAERLAAAGERSDRRRDSKPADRQSRGAEDQQS
jgi:hypothetical protein